MNHISYWDFVTSKWYLILISIINQSVKTIIFQGQYNFAKDAFEKAQSNNNSKIHIKATIKLADCLYHLQDNDKVKEALDTLPDMTDSVYKHDYMSVMLKLMISQGHLDRTCKNNLVQFRRTRRF